MVGGCMADRQEYLRRLPAVHRLLETGPVRELLGRFPRTLVAAVTSRVIDEARQAILSASDGQAPGLTMTEEYFAGLVAASVQGWAVPSLGRVINASGVVLHTNLGRAPLAAEARAAVAAVAAGYSNLEFDLEEGTRGSRQTHVEPIICHLTGGEAAMVVNNNAGAVLLVLSALARDREVVVSRGELVEIGGSFRVPEVMSESGARLVEVGTTNKTRLADYERAVSDQTALLLKVHTSNYRIMGFTEETSLAELADLGTSRGLPVVYDLGSGVMVDLSPHGLPGEPTVRDSLDQGADLVTFSGDKLLGGPQAGVIVGRRPLVERCRRHPLVRVLRSDKLSLAGLEATLKLYLDPEKVTERIPALSMLTRDPAELRRQALGLAARLRRRLPRGVTVRVSDGASQVGGGALPLAEPPTSLVVVENLPLSLSLVEVGLRRHSPPVVARVHREQLLLDPRTLLPGDEEVLCSALSRVLTPGGDQNRKAGETRADGT